jgi:hypothetical protein
MSEKEIWEQKSFADFGGDGKENKEALDHYLIPKGTIVWPEKGGRVIDRYRGALTESALATPVFKETEEKRQKREKDLLFWELLGTTKELPDGSMAVKNSATLYFDGRYWQIKSGDIIATGSKKENKISKIK